MSRKTLKALKYLRNPTTSTFDHRQYNFIHLLDIDASIVNIVEENQYFERLKLNFVTGLAVLIAKLFAESSSFTMSEGDIISSLLLPVSSSN